MGLLLGQDNAAALVPFEIRKGERSEPFACRTLFGWAVNGPCRVEVPVNRKVVSHLITHSVEEQGQILCRLENNGLNKQDVSWSQEDSRVITLCDNESKFVQDCDDVSSLIADSVNCSFYVDDCLKSVPSAEQASSVTVDTQDLFAQRGFNLAKFIVNDNEILQSIPEQHGANKVKEIGSHIEGKVPGSFDVERWLHDPEFLMKPKSDRKIENPDLEMPAGDPEVKIEVCVTASNVNPSPNAVEKLFAHYSSWHRLKRANAWFRRFGEFLKGIKC